VPMKRLGEPEEIGELMLFTCSDACPYMTADTVYVNGGGGWRQRCIVARRHRTAGGRGTRVTGPGGTILGEKGPVQSTRSARGCSPGPTLTHFQRGANLADKIWCLVCRP
jgi:hypothetical protein